MNEESFLDRIPCGIVKLNLEKSFPVLNSNQLIKTWFHTPASLKDIISSPDYLAAEKKIRDYLANHQEQLNLEFKTKEQDNFRWYSMNLRYIPGEELLYCSVSDITSNKKNQEYLRVREEQFRFASQHSGCLICIYDIPSRTLSPSPEFSKTFPFPYILPLNPEFLTENGIVHRESIVNFLDFFHSMESGIPDGKCILRLKTGTGNYHWFSTHYSLVCDDDNIPVRGIISYQDITDQYEKELAYQRWMEYMHEQKKDCIGYYEYNTKFDIFEEIIGELAHSLPMNETSSFSEIMSYIAEHFIYEEDREAYLKFFNKDQLLYSYYQGNRSLKLEHRRLKSDGTIYWGLGMVQIVADPYTGNIKAFILIKDIDAAKREVLALQELSQQDALTGLLNRATAIRTIKHIFQSGQGHHILIMLDIDRFKQLNDSYGHQFGDKTLHRAASRLKSALRREDIFGRLGGDEFIILLKDVSYSMDLYTRLENLCNMIGSALEPEIHISGSFGTSAYPEDGTDFEELYAKADIALYHAKKHGRGQYAIYEPGMCMDKT